MRTFAMMSPRQAICWVYHLKGLSRALRYPECSVFGLVGVVVVACCSG
jgi:hypothetical protein